MLMSRDFPHGHSEIMIVTSFGSLLVVLVLIAETTAYMASPEPDILSSPSPSPGTTHGAAGRPKMSPVWDFRVRVSENKMSACEVIRIQLVCWRMFAPPNFLASTKFQFKGSLEGISPCSI